MRPSIALLAVVLELSVGSLSAQNVPNAASAIFALSVPNEKPARGRAPEGMVWIRAANSRWVPL